MELINQNFHCSVRKIVWSAVLASPSIYPTRKASGIWTIAEMSASVWTASTSVQTFGAIIHPNSEFWQRIGQPYVRKSGRCFVAVVDIEADNCAVCPAELDAVQSEADRQADVCARRLSGRVGGQATNSLPMMEHYKKLFHVKHSY